MIERQRGSRNDFQLPMLVHVGVSSSGEAVIRSYEWATLAVKTEIVQSPERDAPDDKASAVMRLVIKNHSDHTITLPLKTGNCSFELVPVRQLDQELGAFVGERSECADAPVERISLAPEQTHSVDFDLNRTIWYVMYNDKPTPLGKLPWSYRYRIQYQGETIPGVKGDILSRAFHGRGNVD